ncbi:uncharacterized protein LOC124606613 [Schistocerca americana]|uniref:uncharacterized protein LOC124606613 n=1 Tax=Schistocerca americana TaxID=7009 RepID=UPI001F4FBA4A|nr:uncharacterized protein LOC124606613 [Schistocerca americana]
MVERLHRTLKAALMCSSTSWPEALPLVLLGLRTAVKEDLQCSYAAVVYGEQLRVPGEFIVPASTQPFAPELCTQFARQLSVRMRNIKPTNPVRHGDRRVFVHKELQATSHVWLRDDTVRPPLVSPYSGPYRVITRGSHSFKIDKDVKKRQSQLSGLNLLTLLPRSAKSSSNVEAKETAESLAEPSVSEEDNEAASAEQEQPLPAPDVFPRADLQIPGLFPPIDCISVLTFDNSCYSQMRVFEIRRKSTDNIIDDPFSQNIAALLSLTLCV